jgi:hypothetical protein
MRCHLRFRKRCNLLNHEKIVRTLSRHHGPPRARCSGVAEAEISSHLQLADVYLQQCASSVPSSHRRKVAAVQMQSVRPRVWQEKQLPETY